MIYARCDVKAASPAAFLGREFERFTKLRNEEIFLAKCAGACALLAFDLSKFSAVSSVGQFGAQPALFIGRCERMLSFLTHIMRMQNVCAREGLSERERDWLGEI
jgi:hypothetical protein